MVDNITPGSYLIYMNNTKKVTNLNDYKARFGDISNVYFLIRSVEKLTKMGNEYLIMGTQLQAKLVNGKLVKTFPPKK